MNNARLPALAAIALLFGCSSQAGQTRTCGSNDGVCISGSSAGNSSGGARAGGGSANTAGASATGGSSFGGSSFGGGASGGSAGFVDGGVSGSPSGGAFNSGGGSGSVGGSGVSGGASGMGAGAAGTGAAGAAGNIVGQCTAPIPGLPSYNGNGSVTFYTFSMGSDCSAPPTNKCVNCGYPVTAVSPDTVSHAYTNGGQYFAAMNTDFNGAAACGACVQVTRDGSRSVVATVVDQCPTSSNARCKKGHIDLSQAAFLQLGTASEGYLGTGNGGMYGSISWKYVACPVPSTQDVTMRLKEPDNQYYTAVIIQDDLFPIKSVTINGAAATLDATSNFWLVGDGNQAPGPWDVQALDVNGWGFETTLAQGQSGDVSTGHRATCN